MQNVTYEEKLGNLSSELLNWLFKEVYWDLNEEQRFVLENYLNDFTELFKKTKQEEVLKNMFEGLPDWVNKIKEC